MVRSFVISFLIVTAAATLFLMGLLQPIDNRLRALRFNFDNHAPSGQVVMVDIDAKSLDYIGVWPWKRRVYARLLDQLSKLGAAEVAFDIDFSSASDPIEDALFAEALERAGGATVLAAFNQPLEALSGNTRLHANLPIPQLLQHAWPAMVNVFARSDGRIHTFPFGEILAGEPVQSMAVVMSGHAGPVSRDFVIDFGIDAGKIQRFSVSDILEGKVPAASIAGKKVIVGASAAELRDFFAVPRFGIISGSLLQVLATETLLQGRMIRLSDSNLVLFLLFIMGGLTVLILRNGKLRVSMGVLVIMALTLEGAATWLQVSYAYSIQSSASHLTILSFAVFAVAQEIDFRKILQINSENKEQNTRTILDLVIADNFDGVVIVREDDSIYAASGAAARILGEYTIDLGADLTGLDFSKIAPEPFVEAIRTAIGEMKSGRWQSKPPHILDAPFGTAERKILEFVVVPSRQEGGLALDGRKMPDSFVACLSFRDITKRRISEEKIAYLARYDTTTGLPNRNHFSEQLSTLLKDQSTHKTGAAVVCLSLDRLDNLEHTLGHKNAEKTFIQAVKRAQHMLSSDNFLACNGSGSLLFLIKTMPDKAAVQTLVKYILEELAKPYFHSGHGAVVGTSAGIVMISEASRSVDTLLVNTNAALNRAQKLSGNSLCFFEPVMETNLRARQELEIDLWKAFKRKEFEVFYQPQISMSDGALLGAEALLRWKHPEKGYISPAEFIPIAEQSSLIIGLGKWVLEQACRDVSAWPDHLKVAVNVSPVQFAQGDLVKTVEAALRGAGITARQLGLEITESLFIEDNDQILHIMEKLRQMDICFALDDFGTGYSSLSYIQNFPLDKIKIDQSFVKNLDLNPQSLAIIRTISALAESLGLQSVAEGIETEDQQLLLKLAGCTIGQGYLYGKPMPHKEMMAFIARSCGDNPVHKQDELVTIA